MRLLDTDNLKLQEFPPDCIPHYAILSHTWTDEEVSFADFVKISEIDDRLESRKKTNLKGYKKIKSVCLKARTDGYRYVWVDTCCIDKSSSAELSEAINSMYRWYSASECCYVYLDGFAYPDDVTRDLGKCRWFTRAWTLQELIAPPNVRLYDQNWRFIGDKHSLANLLQAITGIPASVLKNTESCFSKSVAQRMSWASSREATREEDVAYSLMGIFDVNMPMLYGEGRKSFRRLQEEIRKASTDQTLFAWAPFPDDPPETGLLAVHPRNFRDSAKFEDVSRLMAGTDLSQEGFSGRGINTNVFLPPPFDKPQPESEQGLVRAMLKCAYANDPDSFACITLRRLQANGVEYVRRHAHPGSFTLSMLKGIETNVFVPHSTMIFEAGPMLPRYIEVVEHSPDTSQSRVSALTPVSAPGPFPTSQQGDPTTDIYASEFPLRFFDGGEYRESDPAMFRYHMPWLPGQEILKICISLQDPPYSVYAHLRLGENGTIEYDVEHGHISAKTRKVKASLSQPSSIAEGVSRRESDSFRTHDCFVAQWRAYRDYYEIAFVSFMDPTERARVVNYDLRRSLGASGASN